MRSIRLRPKAEEDIDSHFEFLAASKLQAADRFLDSVRETLAFIASMTDPGIVWESDDPSLAGMRFWKVTGFPHHLLFFRATSDDIDVVRLLHSARDLDSAIHN